MDSLKPAVGKAGAVMLSLAQRLCGEASKVTRGAGALVNSALRNVLRRDVTGTSANQEQGGEINTRCFIHSKVHVGVHRLLYICNIYQLFISLQMFVYCKLG